MKTQTFPIYPLPQHTQSPHYKVPHHSGTSVITDDLHLHIIIIQSHSLHKGPPEFHLPVMQCGNFQAISVGNLKAHFISRLSRSTILSFCCLISNFFKDIVLYILSVFCCSSRRVCIVPVTSSWADAEVYPDF